MTEDMKELRDRITALSDEELVAMVTVNAEDYREDALHVARMELRSRGVDFSTPRADDLERVAVDPLAPAAPAVGDGATCACGGKLRSAVLVGERELTVVFTDNQEERFVKVLACVRCGQMSLIADFETNVE
jgi:hypothetical protein